jgi:lipid II:glycine glycyltransferase (peptidoglycan interpeptide bridge formation enzyme)
MELEWKERKIEEWRSYLLKVPRTNYLQSIPFARAVLESDKKVTRIGLIRDGERELGILSLQELKIGPLHVIHLYRGPLWFDENPPESHLREFAKLFDREFPRRLLRFRRWIPEWRESSVAKKILHECGFFPRSQTYETAIVDLRLSEDELRKSMRSNWRNHLNQGQRSGMLVSADWKGGTAKLFLHRYEIDRKAKKYHGRSISFMRTEMSLALAYQEMAILWGVKDGKSIAAILVLIHGNSASYRLGWTTDEGRDCHAHNVLLWEAVMILKKRGVAYFDLVGVEPTTAAGLTHFKSGMGGEAFKTVGMVT